jgi:hypothetical protein
MGNKNFECCLNRKWDITLTSFDRVLRNIPGADTDRCQRSECIGQN